MIKLNKKVFQITLDKQKDRTLLPWLLVASLLVTVWVCSIHIVQEAPLLNANSKALEHGWRDDKGNEITLPTKLASAGESFTLSIPLTQKTELPQYLMLSAKYLNLQVYLDETHIGSCLCQPDGMKKTLGKKFALIPLPSDTDNKTLRIVVEPLLEHGAQYEIDVPHMGESASLVYSVILEELPQLFIDVVILCFGSFLLIYGIQTLRALYRQNGTQSVQESFLYIGLFAIIFALYSFCITDTIHLFCSASYVTYLMEFLLLALIPLPLLQLVMDNCKKRCRRFLKIGFILVYLNFIIQVLMHFYFQTEFRDMVIFTHALMIISTLMLIPALSSIAFQGKGKLWLPLSFIPVILGAIVDIVSYYLPNTYQKAIGFQTGVLLFLLIQTAYLIRQNLITCERNLKANVYRQMAYSDVLTGIANRAAFEMALSKWSEKTEMHTSIWCICADINNLKMTNDTLGHAAGDELIRGAAKILVASTGTKENVYRTGGDEFICFLYDYSEEQIQEIQSAIQENMEIYNQTHSHVLSMAVGIDYFRIAKQDTIAKLLSRTDALMYQNKRIWKEQQAREKGMSS